MTAAEVSAGEGRIERRIFVVGAPRSGTTLVQSLLAAHDQLTSFTESHFFSRHFRPLPRIPGLPGLPRALLAHNPAPRLHAFLAENDEAPPEAAAWFDDSLRLLPRLPFRTRPAARRFLQVLDQLALRRGKSGWIEKTPMHLRYLPFLESLAEPPPRTDFVHVLRDGLEVLASLFKASKSWERAYTLDECIHRWKTDVSLSILRLEAARGDGPHDHFILYEELTTDPEPVLQRLLRDLGLPWQPSLLERYAQAAPTLITQEESWKASAASPIRPSSTSQEVLNEEQRERVRKKLGEGFYRELRELLRDRG
ncbi:MAG: sulfotransferase [Acidobacteriota bacterium]|nr:sulfotransferase [Acidobacteriota bacterium]